MDLERAAIERLRMASDMSLRLYKQPLVITYSGGKDSDVLLHLAGAAGIPYEVLHSLTTADAPETVWHVRDTFRRLEMAGVKCDIDTHRTPDGGNVTMWNLIPRKLMPPTRLVRYCCAALKETSGRGRWIATGVRWAESQKRKSRGVMEALHRDKNKRLTLMNDNDESRMLMENCQLKGTRTVNPIIDWTDSDIICTHEHEKEPEKFTGYGEDVDLETQLLIPWPYDEIYRWYLGMKICDANGETTKYANEAAKYNSYYQGYFNAYNQAYMPKQYATHFKL